MGMRVVVTGATGNVGTSVLASLAGDPSVESIVGVARREPRVLHPKTQWLAADVRYADLTAAFRGADAVAHLAWMIQPSRDEAELRSTNVEGSARVFRAVADAHVPSLVYASSVGAYSPGPKDRHVDDLALRSPLLDATRAHAALGWMPHRRADDALREVVEGLIAGAGAETPPLVPATARR